MDMPNREQYPDAPSFLFGISTVQALHTLKQYLSGVQLNTFGADSHARGYLRSKFTLELVDHATLIAEGDGMTRVRTDQYDVVRRILTSTE